MANSKQSEFDKRWQAAVRAPAVVTANVQKRDVEISMDTILSRYARMLDGAVAAHAVEKSIHEEVLASLAPVREAMKKVDHKKLKALNLKLTL